MSAAKKSEAEARVKALYYIMQSAEARHCMCMFSQHMLFAASSAGSEASEALLAIEHAPPYAEQTGRR